MHSCLGHIPNGSRHFVQSVSSCSCPAGTLTQHARSNVCTVHRTGSGEGRQQLAAQGMVTGRLIWTVPSAHWRLVCIFAAQRAVIQRAHSRLKVQPQLQRPARRLLPEGLQARCTALMALQLQQLPATHLPAAGSRRQHFCWPTLRQIFMSARASPSATAADVVWASISGPAANADDLQNASISASCPAECAAGVLLASCQQLAVSIVPGGTAVAELTQLFQENYC